MSCADDLLYASPLPGCLERSVFVALTCIFAVIYGLYTLACAKAAHVRYAEKTTNLQHVAIYGMSAMSSAFALTSVVLNATSASPAVKMFFFKISIIALLSLLIKALYFITRLLVASVVSRRSRKSRRKSRKQGGDASGGSKEMQSIMTLSWRDPFTALLLFSVYGSGIGLSFAGAVLGLASHEDLGVVVFSSGISAFALVFATLVYVQVTKMQRYVEHTIAGVKSPASAVAVGAPRSSNLVSSPGGSSLGTSDPKRGKPKHGFEVRRFVASTSQTKKTHALCRTFSNGSALYESSASYSDVFRRPCGRRTRPWCSRSTGT